MTKWQLRQQQRQEQRHAMMTGLFKAQYAKYKSKGVLQNKPDALRWEKLNTKMRMCASFNDRQNVQFS